MTQDANITPQKALEQFLEIIKPMTKQNREKFIEGLLVLFSPLGQRIIHEAIKE